MPTYDYECGSCGHRYEVYQSIIAKPTKKCPACGKRTAKRLIGAGAGIIFRGSGFYQTDYRSDSYKKTAKAESDAASGTSKKDKSETKPAESKPTESKQADRTE